MLVISTGQVIQKLFQFSLFPSPLTFSKTWPGDWHFEPVEGDSCQTNTTAHLYSQVSLREGFAPRGFKWPGILPQSQIDIDYTLSNHNLTGNLAL